MLAILIPAGDLALVEGDFREVEGSLEVRQNIETRYRFFLGEWFLDQREGVPWYRDVFGKNIDRELARSVLLQVLEQTPGVLAVDTFELTFDEQNRKIDLSFVAQTSDGPVNIDLTI